MNGNSNLTSWLSIFHVMHARCLFLSMSKNTYIRSHSHSYSPAHSFQKWTITFSFSRLQIVFACENHRSTCICCFFHASFSTASHDFSPLMTGDHRRHIHKHTIVQMNEQTSVTKNLNNILSRSLALVNCGSQFRKNSIIRWSSIVLCLHVCVCSLDACVHARRQEQNMWCVIQPRVIDCLKIISINSMFIVPRIHSWKSDRY